MSLTNRKPRPLTRDVKSLRDDRLFIVACDDTYAPQQYFSFFRMPRVRVHVVPTQDGTSTAQHVLDRLLQYDHEEDDELWLLLDVDHCCAPNHIGGFLQALAKAKQQRVNVALSKPCFEFWLLLHHDDAMAEFADCKSTEEALRSKLGEYNKTNLRPEHFPLSSVAAAFRRAKQLDGTVSGGDIPVANTTRVYQLWRAIAAVAPPWQVPKELQEFLAEE